MSKKKSNVNAAVIISGAALAAIGVGGSIAGKVLFDKSHPKLKDTMEDAATEVKETVADITEEVKEAAEDIAEDVTE